jgi:putative flippase GtrA
MKKKYLLYIIFAIICTIINIGSQLLTELLISPVNILQTVVYTNLEKSLRVYDIIKIIVGTGLGFMSKFILDKFFVFREKYENISHTFKQIIVYGILAVFTTLIFWSFQISFKLLFTFIYAEEVGAVIGLGIGYTIKFFLDRKFVFIPQVNKEQSKLNLS